MNNDNSHKKINFQHVYYKKFIIARKKKFLLLQEVNCKKQGRKKRLKRKLQKARKNANAKEKNLSEIYSKQGKRQGGKKNLRKIYKEQRRKKKPKQ